MSEKKSPVTIKVCTGPKCKASFSEYILKRLNADIEKSKLHDQVSIETCGCTGNCKQSPTVFIDEKLHLYMNPIKASEEMQKSIATRKRS